MISFLSGWCVLMIAAWVSLGCAALYSPNHIIYGWQVVVMLLGIGLSRSIYWLILYPSFFTPFRDLPTPPTRWPLTGNQSSLFGEFPWDVARRCAETVPNEGLIRYYVGFSNERLLVTSSNGLSQVLVHGAYDFKKTNLAQFAIKRFTGNGLGFLDGEEHQTHKKGLYPAFSSTSIRELIPTFWEKATEMVRRIEISIQDATPGAAIVPLHNWGTRATLDIIGVAGMGYDFETLRNPNNELSAQYRKMFLEPTNAFNWLELLGNYIDFRLLLKLPVKKNQELTEGCEYIRRVAREVIRHQSNTLGSSVKGNNNILAVALASGVFTEDSLVDHVMTFLVAGHESTATAFEWAIFELGQRPEMQSRLRGEIRARIPTMDRHSIPDLARAIEGLPYLNAVCSEVLRFYPFVPFATRVASKDSKILGTLVPKGTVVAFAAHAINHDKTLWGPDADEFDPERWMKPKQAKSGGAPSNFALLTFSAGPKGCIGQGWTRMELACLVAATVGRFRLNLVNPEEKQLKVGKTMKLKAGVHAHVEILDGW